MSAQKIIDNSLSEILHEKYFLKMYAMRNKYKDIITNVCRKIRTQIL